MCYTLEGIVLPKTMLSFAPIRVPFFFSSSCIGYNRG